MDRGSEVMGVRQSAERRSRNVLNGEKFREKPKQREILKLKKDKGGTLMPSDQTPARKTLKTGKKRGRHKGFCKPRLEKKTLPGGLRSTAL